MMQYIAEAQGLWYEGTQAWLRRIQGQSIILPFAVVGDSIGQDRLFLEDYFNSSTRIRRGRLFERDNRNAWSADCVSRFPNRDTSNPSNIFNVNRAYRTASVQPKLGAEVDLGDSGANSRWIVVLSERIGLEGCFVTLKSKAYLGVLPELIISEIPASSQHDVQASIEAVVETATMQAPQAVIDTCRNAACYVISARYPASNPDGTNDLGPLVRYLGVQKMQAQADAGDLIRQLHVRAKANAAARHKTRPVSRNDAELAVSALAFLLQDFGWAAND
ncbi:hypothetical protein [Dyella sp.]|uniref:hypothetical protein n=1 Tax=Dyella sp. TaxID=1869338 RepID=UPI002B48E8B6|nr:hypothetical protein [Dyella sp.]HKT27976.1 hypothetical protein [Dyella sp.]